MKFRLMKSYNSTDEDQKLTEDFDWAIEDQSYKILLDTRSNKMAITANIECKFISTKKMGELAETFDIEKVSEDKWSLEAVNFYRRNRKFINELDLVYNNLKTVLIDFILLLNFNLNRRLSQKSIAGSYTCLYYNEKKESWLGVGTYSPLTEGVIGLYKRSRKIDHRFLVQLDQNLKRHKQPTTAIRYLSVGEESKPNFRWIITTASLEIAIKEILIDLDPKLEYLILEFPAPPLFKMYKGVLESISGYESPYYKEIQKGVEVRNILIHRPTRLKIFNQDAVNYHYMAKCAIDHLIKVAASVKANSPLKYKADKSNKIDFNRYLK